MNKGQKIVYDTVMASGKLDEKQCKRFASFMRFMNNRQCPDCGEIKDVVSAEAKFLQGFGKSMITSMLSQPEPTGRVYCCLECGNVFTDIM